MNSLHGRRALVVGAIVALCVGLGGTATAEPVAAGPGAGGSQQVVPGQRISSAPARKAQPNAVATYRQFTANYGPLTVQPGESYNAWVYCPAGMVVTGGGETNSSAGQMVLKDTYPVSGNGGWQVTVTSMASVNETLTVYAACMSGLNDYGPIIAKTSMAPGEHAYVSAYCPPNTQVLGGGGFTDTLTDSEFMSGTLSAGQWNAFTQNNDTVPHTLSSEVMCGSDVTSYQIVQGASIDVPGNQEAVATVYCPAGTWVLGGGGQGGDLMNTTDSFPLYPSQGWQADFYNYDSEDDGYNPTVVCGN